MPAPAPPISSGRALGLGLGQTLSLWPAAIAAFLCGAVEVVAGLLATLGVLEALFDSRNIGLAALGGALTAWLGARIVRALVEGGAIRQGTERLKGRGFSSLSAEALRAAPRALSFAAWSFPLALLYALWTNLALLAVFAAYFSSLANARLGFVSSSALALFLTLSLPLAVFWALWGRVAFVRAVSRDEGVLVSLYEAAAVLWNRPWPRAAVLLLTGVAAVFAELTLGGFVNAVSAPPGGQLPSLSLALGGQLVAGLLVAYVAALIELTRLQSLLALELSEEGALPAPRAPAPPAAPPAPIVDAEVIVDAQPVGPLSRA